MDLENKTSIFIVVGDKPIGFITAFRESRTRNGGYVSSCGFSPAYVPASVLVTLEVNNAFLTANYSDTLPELSNMFEIIAVNRTSRIDCFGFGITQYKFCQFISTGTIYQLGQNNLAMEMATVNCGSVSSYRGIEKEARRLLDIVMPNGWSN